VTDLRARLVPLDARTARVCRYGSLDARFEGGGVLGRGAAARLEREANGLGAAPLDQVSESSGCVGGPAYFVTFASTTQTLSIWGDACNNTTNGVLAAPQPTSWQSELRRLTPDPRPR
jgi:hypothetical protein